MEYPTLGGTDFQVLALGLGGLSRSGAYGAASDDESIATLHRAFDLGINFGAAGHDLNAEGVDAGRSGLPRGHEGNGRARARSGSMVARPRARAELLRVQAAARREPSQPVGVAPQGVAAIAGAAYLAGLMTPQTGIAAMLRAFHGASANVQSPARSGSGPPPATSPPAAS